MISEGEDARFMSHWGSRKRSHLSRPVETASPVKYISWHLLPSLSVHSPSQSSPLLLIPWTINIQLALLPEPLSRVAVVTSKAIPLRNTHGISKCSLAPKSYSEKGYSRAPYLLDLCDSGTSVISRQEKDIFSITASSPCKSESQVWFFLSHASLPAPWPSCGVLLLWLSCACLSLEGKVLP